MASTPPPPSPSSLRVPTAPRHGAGYDQYEPYPTRFSARLASQRASRINEKTPEPNCPSSPSKMRYRASPKKNRKVEEETLSPPKSEAKLHNNSHFAQSAAYNHTLDFDISGSHNRHPSRSRSAVNQSLPTPAKTPSKRKIADDLSSASRTLFPTHGRMASKKPSHLSLDSFETPAAPKEIQIYTDSRDRIPVSVAAMKTPFAAKIEKDSPGKWASKRSTNEPSSSSHDSPVTIVYHPNDSDNEDTKKSITQDGMTMIFRGKKVYNKFEEEEDDGDDEMGLFAARPDLLDDSDDLLSSVQPLSRNSIKPRVLFPSQKPQDQDQSVHEEEAATDDEDGYEADPQSPLADSKSPVFTPQSPEFPRAPGATRLLRSNARFGSQLDLTPTVSASSDAKRKRISPFDQWLRKKQSPEDTAVPTTPKKREADRSGSPVAPPSAKKTRSTRGAVVPLV